MILVKHTLALLDISSGIATGEISSGKGKNLN